MLTAPTSLLESFSALSDATRCRMLALLERLSPKKRIAFILVAVEGCSLAEAAALIGAAEDTVKQRVLHARRDLLARLATASATRTGRPVEGTS